MAVSMVRSSLVVGGVAVDNVLTSVKSRYMRMILKADVMTDEVFVARVIGKEVFGQHVSKPTSKESSK